MLLFRSEETVNRWCQARQISPRPLVTLDQLWHLAVVWYADRLTVESKRPSPAEMIGIFATVGLAGPFWDPQADAWPAAP